MDYFLYILQSEKSGKYYVGISQNPERRLMHHNTIEKGFTSRYRPWKIVFKKIFKTKEDAVTAENKVKGWKSKHMIERIITGKTQI